MKNTRSYHPEDKMASLISDDYRLLQVLSRFGISLGFGDKSIQQVCDDTGVDCKTFLAVVNFIINGQPDEEEVENLSLVSLLHYLKQSHIYFLEFCLPAIRRRLLDGIKLKDSDVSFLILKLFDEYVEGVAAHMTDEEQHLFPIIEDFINNNEKETTDIPDTDIHHERVGLKLKELKNIIIKYCPAQENANLLNAALYDIYRCEEELTSHSRIEDHLLIPALKNNFYGGH